MKWKTFLYPKMLILSLCFVAFCLNSYAQTTLDSIPRQPQVGIATYYSTKLHGNRTSSGERYDKNKLTAAHRSLPLGTYLRVICTDTGEVVYVKVNDRGPRSKNLLLDLSWAAAKKLGMLRKGRAEVYIEVISKEEALAGQKEDIE